MSIDDPLDGFRDEGTPDLSDGEARLLRSLMENRGMLEVINVGLDMQRFLATPAGREVWTTNERKLSDSIVTWLSTTDPASAEVKSAHFNARVAIEVLKTFQEAIDAGRETRLQMHMRQGDEQEAEG